MKFLRTALIVFGWIIPFTTILGALASIYVLHEMAEIRETVESVSIWQVIKIILDSLRGLALSPLCFFGVYLLGENR